MDSFSLCECSAICHDSGMTPDFWDRLVEAFADAGLETSQSAIARHLGIAQSAVAKWKLGTGYPHLRKCLAIAEMTGVSADWLLTGRGKKKQEGEHMDELTQALLERWADLPKATQREILEYVSFKASQPRQSDMVRQDQTKSDK